ELTDRKKQYEYYRDSLLTFGDEVSIVTLGEIATIIRGGNFQKKDFRENGVPCIHYGQIYTKYGLSTIDTLTFIEKSVAEKSKFAQKNDIVMAVTSENVEDVCKCVVWLGEEDVAISGHTAIIKHNQNAKFLAYYFNTATFFKDKKKLAHGTKVIEVTPSTLAKIKIPLPPLPEQQRIVDILDRFDTLCNDISSGLPAEIKARQQQYEYYRDKLLTFKNIAEKET
ncbi:MAG: restriction endonuclease subunit S, partial [Anaerovoracaceae bacterium]